LLLILTSINSPDQSHDAEVKQSFQPVTAPNDALDVVGDIDATGYVQTDDTGTIGGTCVSDARLKHNITPLVLFYLLSH